MAAEEPCVDRYEARAQKRKPRVDRGDKQGIGSTMNRCNPEKRDARVQNSQRGACKRRQKTGEQ